MRRHFALLLAVLLLPGCLGLLPPLRTNSTVTATVAAPVKTDVHLTTCPPRTGDQGPVVAMPLDGDCPVPGPRIAVIDVDGVLLNQNYVGPYSFGDNPVAVFREKLDAAAACTD